MIFANSIEEGYRHLAIAIVKQAVEDYRNALRGIVYRGTSAEYVKKECARFFRSGWFTHLTDANGKYILRLLNEEYRKEIEEGENNEGNTDPSNT